MLKEAQVAELLRRCELIAGRPLHQLRGNLRSARTRAEAVWELLVVDAAAQLGRIEYESPEGGPDIGLWLPTGRRLAIEVTYLHPRFAEEERRSALVARWMYDAAKAMEPLGVTIECRFDGDRNDPAGPRRRLPAEHERKQFMASVEVADFLSRVRGRPLERHKCVLTGHSISLEARPCTARENNQLTFGGLSQEVAKEVREHALYRALRSKLNQHNVDGPHLVCIGSDVSPALRSPLGGYGIRVEQALGSAFRSGRLSGAIIVSVESKHSWFEPISRVAHCVIHPAAGCRYPLTREEWEFVAKMDFNRWRYTFPLSRREAPSRNVRGLTGSMSLSSTGQGTMKIKLPATVLVDVLAGRSTLLDQYGGSADSFGKSILHVLQKGSSIVGCDFENGDLEKGRPATVILEISPPHEPVFGRPKQS